MIPREFCPCKDRNIWTICGDICSSIEPSSKSFANSPPVHLQMSGRQIRRGRPLPFSPFAHHGGALHGLVKTFFLLMTCSHHQREGPALCQGSSLIRQRTLCLFIYQMHEQLSLLPLALEHCPSVLGGSQVSTTVGPLWSQQ